MKRFLASFLFLLLSATYSFADCGYVFKGKIGNYPIVLTIWATAVEASGEYYYVSQGKNKTLALEGYLDFDEDNVWYFTERVNGKRNGAFKLKWNLSIRDGYKTMKGTYRNIKGQSFNVVLNCVKVIENPDHI